MVWEIVLSIHEGIITWVEWEWASNCSGLWVTRHLLFSSYVFKVYDQAGEGYRSGHVYSLCFDV